MDTAADLRRIAKSYRKRALSADRPALQGVFMTLASEFDRDAASAERQARLLGRNHPHRADEAPPARAHAA